MSGRVLLGATLAAAVLAVPVGAQEEPEVHDPLGSGEAPPTSADIRGTVRDLELRGTVHPIELRDAVRTLEPKVRELRVEVQEGGRTTVTISSDVLFDFDSAELTDAARQALGELAERIVATQGDVLVVGHTDGIGTRAYNQDLSERRAAAVAEALRERVGPDRPLATEGRAFDEPIEPETVGGEDNPEGRARNRRVEISFDEAEG